MLYIDNMAAKPVQVSLDADLLERIDADPETRARGRSAFVRSAVERYLAAKQRRDLETRIAAAYRGRADAVLEETVSLLDAQEWPDK
jgi:metal-responsive CopG/Arc/MetJ family transcriptional regulator